MSAPNPLREAATRLVEAMDAAEAPPTAAEWTPLIAVESEAKDALRAALAAPVVPERGQDEIEAFQKFWGETLHGDREQPQRGWAEAIYRRAWRDAGVARVVPARPLDDTEQVERVARAIFEASRGPRRVRHGDTAAREPMAWERVPDEVKSGYRRQAMAAIAESRDIEVSRLLLQVAAERGAAAEARAARDEAIAERDEAEAARPLDDTKRPTVGSLQAVIAPIIVRHYWPDHDQDDPEDEAVSQAWEVAEEVARAIAGAARVVPENPTKGNTMDIDQEQALRKEIADLDSEIERFEIRRAEKVAEVEVGEWMREHGR